MKQPSKPDQSFDSIADKFDHNIYGSTKGRLRHELLVHYLHQCLDFDSRPLRVLDAGGGTGVMTRELLASGCHVTLNDISADALSRARQKLPENAPVTLVEGEIQSLPAKPEYDLVVCHAVLEWLQSPLTVLPKLYNLIKPGGRLSLSFFNRDAHRFGNLLYGNFDYVKGGMKNKNTVRLNPNQSLVPGEVINSLRESGFLIQHEAGIRCFHDYMKQPDMQITHYDALKAMELEYGCQPPYKWLGKYFHIIAQKPV